MSRYPSVFLAGDGRRPDRTINPVHLGRNRFIYLDSGRKRLKKPDYPSAPYGVEFGR